MSPAEQALIDKSPTFADLCWKVREARIALKAAQRHRERCQTIISQAKAVENTRREAVDEAEAALDAYVERECAE